MAIRYTLLFPDEASADEAAARTRRDTGLATEVGSSEETSMWTVLATGTLPSDEAHDVSVMAALTAEDLGGRYEAGMTAGSPPAAPGPPA